METFLFLLAGFTIGFLLIYLVRLGQGNLVNCTRCGQQHWVNPRKPGPVCKKCGTPLKIQKRKPGQKHSNAGGNKRKSR